MGNGGSRADPPANSPIDNQCSQRQQSRRYTDTRRVRRMNPHHCIPTHPRTRQQHNWAPGSPCRSCTRRCLRTRHAHGTRCARDTWALCSCRRSSCSHSHTCLAKHTIHGSNNHCERYSQRARTTHSGRRRSHRDTSRCTNRCHRGKSPHLNRVAMHSRSRCSGTWCPHSRPHTHMHRHRQRRGTTRHSDMATTHIRRDPLHSACQ